MNRTHLVVLVLYLCCLNVVFAFDICCIFVVFLKSMAEKGHLAVKKTNTQYLNQYRHLIEDKCRIGYCRLFCTLCANTFRFPY